MTKAKKKVGKSGWIHPIITWMVYGVLCIGVIVMVSLSLGCNVGTSKSTNNAESNSSFNPEETICNIECHILKDSVTGEVVEVTGIRQCEGTAPVAFDVSNLDECDSVFE